MAKNFVNVRCPACGKTSRLDNFYKGARGEHAMQAADLHSRSQIMVMGGWSWTWRDISKSELQLVSDAITTVAARLESVLVPDHGHDLGVPLPSNRREALQYLLDAEEAVRSANAELLFRQKEVNAIFGRVK